MTSDMLGEEMSGGPNHMTSDMPGEKKFLWGQGLTIQLSVPRHLGLSALVTFCTWPAWSIVPCSAHACLAVYYLMI